MRDKIKYTTLVPLSLTTTLLLSGTILLSSAVSADDTSVTTTTITVPIACTMTGSGMSSHTATLNPGTYSGASGSEYQNGIGKTTLTAICNDDNGFSIYAIGFTGNEYSGENHTKLVGSTTGGTIATKAYASGDTTSNWSMKLTKVTNTSQSYNPQNLTLTTGYDAWHAVPDTYTKVAEYHANTGSSATDTTLGVKLETTYAAFIVANQPADTYTGQVKYTMVHPYDAAPAQPQSCPSGRICYFANASDAVGTMGQQTIPTSGTTDGVSPTSATLLASNFSRTGYGFAGWSDKFDYATNSEAKFYGPQEDIAFTTGQYSGSNPGLSLYAVWVKSEGSIQDQSKVASICNSLTTAPTDGTANLTSVSALTDQRDNNTYAIAKLADGKCWMIENLRLESTAEHNSDGTLAQGYGTSATYGNFGGLANAENSGFSSTYTVNSLYYSGTQSGTASINIGTTDRPGYRIPRYNNLNTTNRASNPTSNIFAENNTTGGIYSYGNYYNWHAAIADTTYYTDGDRNTTSICPTGWHLPTGEKAYNSGSASGVNVTGDTSTFREFYNLGYKTMDEVTAYEDTPNDGYARYSSNTTNAAGKTAIVAFRSFPNNLLYSGYFLGSSAIGRGSIGNYWSSTALNNVDGYYLLLNSSNVLPGTGTNYMYRGISIRCIVGS